MRLFIASSFPESVTDDLHARVATLKPRLPSAAWTRPETQHLTYAFLGEQDQSLIDTLAPALEERLGVVEKFTAVLRGCGFFPNHRRARVGWVGLDPQEPFRNIAVGVREVVTRSGIALDRADFRPHLTLLRIRDAWPPASAATFEQGLRDYRSAPFVVDAITLYSSRLSPTGAIHTPVRHFALA